jgi:hypothetical protein
MREKTRDDAKHYTCQCDVDWLLAAGPLLLGGT